MSSVQLWIAALLALAVLLTQLRRSGFSTGQQTLRVLGTALCVSLLWLALYPPQRALAPTALVVLSADAPAEAARDRIAAGATVLALPEAPEIPGVSTAVDLAAALRQTPQARTLEVLGRGLPARDLHSIPAELPLSFVSMTEASGLRHWWLPENVSAGALWSVRGEFAGGAEALVQLFDPAGVLLAQATPDAQGRFRLVSQARSPGRYVYQLQVQGAAQEVHERVDLPVIVTAGAPARVLLLAGAPSPELKYLRRWASDAGIALSSRMALGLNMQIGSARLPAQAAEWSELDLLVLDERSLAALGETGRESLAAAVREGAGLLLRLTGPLGANESSWLARLDLAVREADISTRIDWSDPIKSLASEDSSQLQLTRRPLTVHGELTLPLLSTPQGEAVGVWRPLGRGRVGIVWLSDTYTLQLLGRGDLHGALWQQVFGTLSRGQTQAAAPQLRSPLPLRLEQRMVWCGLAVERSYQLRDSASEQQLLIDPATPGCGGLWPMTSGWAELRDDAGWQRTVYIHAADTAAAQQVRELSELTLRRAQLSPSAASTHMSQPTAQARGPAWPWWLAWLSVSCALWWFERRQAAPRGAHAEPGAR